MDGFGQAFDIVAVIAGILAGIVTVVVPALIWLWHRLNRVKREETLTGGQIEAEIATVKAEIATFEKKAINPKAFRQELAQAGDDSAARAERAEEFLTPLRPSLETAFTALAVHDRTPGVRYRFARRVSQLGARWGQREKRARRPGCWSRSGRNWTRQRDARRATPSKTETIPTQ